MTALGEAYAAKARLENLQAVCREVARKADAGAITPDTVAQVLRKAIGETKQ